MAHYYVEKQAVPTRSHFVHRRGCRCQSGMENSIYLGEYISGLSAVVAARALFPDAAGCSCCLKAAGLLDSD